MKKHYTLPSLTVYNINVSDILLASGEIEVDTCGEGGLFSSFE